MSHIQEAHSFETKKVPVMRPSELSVQNAPNRARFTDEVGPISDRRKAKASLIAMAGSERETHRDTGWLVGRLTRTERLAGRGAKPPIQE